MGRKRKSGQRKLRDKGQKLRRRRVAFQFHNPARDNPCTTVYQLVKELNKHSR